MQWRLISTSVPLSKRRATRDNNRLRGQSTLYRSGIKRPLSVSDEELPVPELGDDVGKMPEEENDPDHGLWGFFYNKSYLPKPTEEAAHGRSWTVQELRSKSWEDLHGLWWMCCRERNRIATAAHTRTHAEMGFGGAEGNARDDSVKKTMRAIRHVLTERFYAWEDARKLAEQDPEINLSGKGPIYTPTLHFENEESYFVEEPVADQADKTEQASEPKLDKSSPVVAVDPSSVPTESAKPVTDAPRSS